MFWGGFADQKTCSESGARDPVKLRRGIYCLRSFLSSQNSENVVWSKLIFLKLAIAKRRKFYGIWNNFAVSSALADGLASLCADVFVAKASGIVMTKNFGSLI